MMAASSQRKREMRKRTRGKPPLAGNEMLDHSQDHYSTEVVIGRFKGELVLWTAPAMTPLQSQRHHRLPRRHLTWMTIFRFERFPRVAGRCYQLSE
jgi:hypothetical protein